MNLPILGPINTVAVEMPDCKGFLNSEPYQVPLLTKLGKDHSSILIWKVFEGGHYIVDCKHCYGYYLKVETTQGWKYENISPISFI